MASLCFNTTLRLPDTDLMAAFASEVLYSSSHMQKVRGTPDCGRPDKTSKKCQRKNINQRIDLTEETELKWGILRK